MTKFESKGERSARIIRTIIKHLNDISIRQLATDIDCNYMQLYYCYNGKTFALSEDLIAAFKNKYPNFNEEFLRSGRGKLCPDCEVDNEEPVEQDIEKAEISDTVDREELLISLMNRVLDLTERLITNEDKYARTLSNLSKRLDEIAGTQTEVVERLDNIN